MSSVAPTNLTEIEVASSQPTDEGVGHVPVFLKEFAKF